MAEVDEWRCYITRDETGAVTAALYEDRHGTEACFLDAASFGPFDTAYDVCKWLTRQLAARSVLPLR